MKIEKYELTKNNNYNIYLSNGEVITLNEKVITENELLIKKEVNDELYKKLINDNEIHELLIKCIKYIEIRLRSTKEIKDYLIKKNIKKEIIEECIEKLKKMDYINDDRFAKAYIKDKINFTQKGDYKIKKELQLLGITEEIINNNIINIDKELLINKIKKVIEKDIKTNKKYSGNILKNKIYIHLVNQGYSKSIILEILNNYNF